MLLAFSHAILFLLAFLAMHSMRSVCSMHGGFIFRNWGPILKVHHSQCLTSMTKHDSDGSPPGAAYVSAKPPHDKTQGATSGLQSQLSPYLPNGCFPSHEGPLLLKMKPPRIERIERPNCYSSVRGTLTQMDHCH
jgi:hypothetical protein